MSEVKIISTSLGLLVFVVLCLNCAVKQNTHLENHIVEGKIETLCKFKSNANPTESESHYTVRLNEVFEFNWEKMYVFDYAVEDHVIFDQIGFQFKFPASNASDKWFFTKSGTVVYFEENPVEKIDEPIQEDDVQFEIKNSQTKFAVYTPDNIFEVEFRRLDSGKFLYLKCISCVFQ